MFKDKIFQRLLQSGKDSLSSVRLAFLYSVFISNLLIFGCWIYLSISSFQMIPIPESVLVFYALANGISTGGKIWQKFLEGKDKETCEQEELEEAPGPPPKESLTHEEKVEKLLTELVTKTYNNAGTTEGENTK